MLAEIPSENKEISYMNRKRRMNGEATAVETNTIRHFPGLATLAEDKKPKRHSFLYHAAVWTGVIMPDPETPRGWTWNPAVITLAILIGGMVAGGGYYLGQRDAENRQMLERLNKAESDAGKALQLGSYKAGSVDAMKGHVEESNTNTGVKK